MNLLSKISGLLGGAKAATSMSRYGEYGSDQYWYRQLIGIGARSTSLLTGDTSNVTERAYHSHELVFSCINKIADVQLDAEIIVEKKNKDGEWETIPDHPLMALIRRPNEYETGRDVRRLMVQSEQVVGIVYIELIRSRSGMPGAMYVLNPQRVTPVSNENRSGVAYYEYRRTDGTVYRIDPDNMIIRRRTDLFNRFYGVSPIEVALRSINSDIGLTEYVDAFFETGGTPSGILRILNATVPDAKKQALQAQWAKSYSRGGMNQGGTAVLDQNADYQRIGANLDELDSENVSSRFESRICSVFGVPPILVGSLVGLEHTTANATMRSALRDFWENKVSPELASMREWLTWFVLPQFDDMDAINRGDLRVSFDMSHVAFLQEEQDDRHRRARDNFKAGLWTLNEAREATGMEPDETRGTDYYVQPANVIALTSDRRAEEAEGGAEAVTDPKALPASVTEPKALPASVTEPAKGEKKKTIDEAKGEPSREPTEVEALIDLKKLVAEQEANAKRLGYILAAFRNKLIEDAVSQLSSLTTETAVELTLAPESQTRKAVFAAIKKAYEAGVSQLNSELDSQQTASGKSGSLTLSTKESDLSDYELELIDSLTDGVISRMIAEITLRAINQFLSLKLLGNFVAELLLTLLRDQSDKWVNTTAADAVNAAIQRGRDAAMKERDGEIDRYYWSAILDQNTCGPCEHLDGKTVSKREDLPDAPYALCEGGGHCRCFVIGVSASEAE